jgi:hypothetical protein
MLHNWDFLMRGANILKLHRIGIFGVWLDSESYKLRDWAELVRPCMPFSYALLLPSTAIDEPNSSDELLRPSGVSRA